jgi:hypothetical protein
MKGRRKRSAIQGGKRPMMIQDTTPDTKCIQNRIRTSEEPFSDQIMLWITRATHTGFVKGPFLKCTGYEVNELHGRGLIEIKQFNNHDAADLEDFHSYLNRRHQQWKNHTLLFGIIA